MRLSSVRHGAISIAPVRASITSIFEKPPRLPQAGLDVGESLGELSSQRFGRRSSWRRRRGRLRWLPHVSLGRMRRRRTAVGMRLVRDGRILESLERMVQQHEIGRHVVRKRPNQFVARLKLHRIREAVDQRFRWRGEPRVRAADGRFTGGDLFGGRRHKPSVSLFRRVFAEGSQTGKPDLLLRLLWGRLVWVMIENRPVNSTTHFPGIPNCL